MTPFGLSSQTLTRITAVLAQFPEIEQVILYGSRAKGNFREGSDIDLVLCGNWTDETLVPRLAVALDALDLPYAFDLVHYERIASSALLEHINRCGKLFYAQSPVG